jgi:hypothetical protein
VIGDIVDIEAEVMGDTVIIDTDNIIFIFDKSL